MTESFSILTSEMKENQSIGMLVKKYKNGYVYARIPVVLLASEVDEGCTYKHTPRGDGQESCTITDVIPYEVVTDVFVKKAPSMLSIYEFSVEEVDE